MEELFSFPLFGSNPELKPQDSRSLELGFRGRWTRGTSLDVALFQIDTEDEIVFDPDSPLGLFGALAALDQVGLDGTVLLFTLGTVAVVALLFGLVPALRLARSPLSGALNERAPWRLQFQEGRSGAVQSEDPARNRDEDRKSLEN